MPATVKCEVTLPAVLEPFVLGVHTIDAQTANIKVEQNKLIATRDNVVIEDGYNVHIIISGAAGFAATMNVFLDDTKINSEPITPDFKNGNYEFLFIREA